MKNKTKTSIGLAIILASAQSMSAEVININQPTLNNQIILNNNSDSKLLIQSILEQQIALKGDDLNILDLNAYLNSLTIEELLNLKNESSTPCMEK